MYRKILMVLSTVCIAICCQDALADVCTTPGGCALPTPTIVSVSWAQAGNITTILGSGSDPYATKFYCDWDDGDGNGDEVSCLEQHIYANPGKYTVSLHTIDDFNDVSDTVQQQIVVVSLSLAEAANPVNYIVFGQ